MAIRIRVYPQPGSIGARRNRMHQQAMQMQRMQQVQMRQQQAMIQQQMLQRTFGVGGMQQPYGYAGYGQPPSYTSSYGSYGGYPSSYGSYSSTAATCPPAYASYGNAYTGASWLSPMQTPGYGYGYGQMSPVQSALNGLRSWLGGW